MSALTYCGLLDDFALRHQDVAIKTLPELNEYLIEAVLFGDGLLINDGYILSHQALQNAVLSSYQSPLRHLVENGYVKILTRNGGKLEVLADEMAQRNITSAQQLIAKPWYLNDYQPALAEWSSRLRSPAFGNSLMNWPNIRTDAIFKSVAKSVYMSLCTNYPKHKAEFDEFYEELNRTPARRTEWEDVADKLVKAEKISVNVRSGLMRAANEVYQYSWGCALGTLSDSVRVLTRLPEYLRDFSLPLGQLTNASKPPIKVFVPNLNFAQQAIRNRWDLLADMVTPGHELNQLKQLFLKCIEKYYVSDEISEKYMKAVAKEYTGALSKHFGKPADDEVIFNLCFLGASTIAGYAFFGPLGLAAGIAFEFIGIVASRLGGSQIFYKLTAPDSKGWITQLQLPQIQLPQAPMNHVSCIQLAPSEIIKHTKNVSPFK